MKLLKLLISFIFCALGDVMAETGHYYPSDRFSSSLISDICQDSQGSIWIATDYGLNKFDGYRFATYLHDDADPNTLGVNTVVSLFCDREGRLWVGNNKGLDRFDTDRDAFVHYPFPGDIHPRISSIIQRRDGTIFIGTAGYGAFQIGADGQLRRYAQASDDSFFDHIFEDSRGRLWQSGFDDVITMRDGKKAYNYHSSVGNALDFVELQDELLILCQHGFMSFRNGKMSEANVDMSVLSRKDVVFSKMVVNSEGIVYIGTRGKGLYRLSSTYPRRLENVSITASGIDPNTSKISAVMADRRGNLWLGCHRKGLLMVPLHPAQFNSWSFSSQGINLGSPISSVCEGDGGMTWCTVQGVGVYGFNEQGRVVSHPSAPDAVEFIFRDKKSRYWIGTDDGLYAYEPLTGHHQLKVSFDCDMFNDMTSDNEGRIYISTFSRGFCVYNPQTGALLNHNFYERDSIRGYLCNNWVMSLSSDRGGLIWIGTSAGFSCYDPRTDSFLSQGWNSLLDGVFCFDICELSKGKLTDGRSLDGCMAVGTEKGLYLYDRKTRKVEQFPGSEQLRDKPISYIVQSNDGDIWCSTSMGIWQYQLSSHSFIGHVNGNGLTQKEYLYGVGMHTDRDMIYFGHNDGLTVFSPNRIRESKSSLDPVQLTAFMVGDQPVNTRTVLNGVKVTEAPVFSSGYFTLSYLDHTITLAFSQLNYDNPMNVIYEYQVNGGEWTRNEEGQNDFTLSHLQPGSYRIAVRALQGGEYTPEKVIIVTIRAPWYRTMLAYFIYFLIAVSVLGYVFYTYRQRASEQLNEEKMKFLINATHDIRSPLTLIMSPLANLKRRLTADQKDAQRDVETIEHNATRILNLVNQILDVRKIDKQQMRLHCEQTDLVDFVQGIYKMFEYNAKERNIKFSFSHDGLEELPVWIDRDQFDKVVTNLLSNAFKYSYDGGVVEMRLSADDAKACLEVVDNGVGLGTDNLKHLFDRFYQGVNSRRLHIGGTGIGLNLCKMIVDMHHGTISAHNRTDERGTVFTVTLPLGREHLTDDEIEQTAAAAPELPADATAPVAGNLLNAQGSKYRILVVDDDVEISRYISTELGRYYKFGICEDGKEGLKELLSNSYDLVISDVMMPKMDGFTMLRMIKTNINISHIPVIMLTSKADVGNRLEGLERGADAFLAKPFDMQELHTVVDNLIQNRQRLKGKYTGAQQQADRVEQPEVKGNDELLMERIMKAVNKNLSNSDFNVDMLTQEVGISRAQLHRKMKEMTGISTSEFIRNIRLEQAARLLREQKINITQVAYTVGFSNLAHFSTIFRKHFGVSPSEFAEQGGEG